MPRLKARLRRFDSRRAAALDVGEYFSFEGAAGLWLIGRADGAAWTHRWRDAATGGIRQRLLGTYPAMSFEEAARALALSNTVAQRLRELIHERPDIAGKDAAEFTRADAEAVYRFIRGG